MVRQKQSIAPEKVAEVTQMVKAIVQNFDNDIKNLVLAKREYSTEFVLNMSTEYRKILSNEILDMQLTDFIKQMEKAQDIENDETICNEPQSSKMAVNNAKTPIMHPSYYKSLKMTDGLHVKVPSCITPRIRSTVQKPRASKFGEILFSVRGTPVLNTVTAANMLEAKKQEVIVQSLLQQEETMLTPETRKIIGKLKELVQKRNGRKENNELDG